MKNWKLQNRILFLALLPGFIISLILGSYFIFQQSTNLYEHLETEGTFITKRLTHSANHFLELNEIQALHELARESLEESCVRAVAITIKGRDNIQVGPRMVNSPFGSTEVRNDHLQVAQTEKTIRFKSPIIANNTIDDIIGWVEVELDTDHTLMLQYKYLASSLGVIALTLIISLLLALKLSQRLARPMNQILRTISDIEQGNLDSRAIIEERNEFSNIAEGINSIAIALERAKAESEQSVEQATREMKETLESMEIQNIEFDMARKQALEGSRVKSEFLANISHEIRTPLNGILGFTKLLKGSHIDNRQADYLDIIEKSSMNLMTIINSILDLSKIDAGKLELENVEFNLRDLIEDALKIQAPEAHRKSLELASLIFSDVPVFVKGDPLRIKQILLNFISNAIKFTEQGNVTVRIHAMKQKKQDAKQVTLQFDVSDTGIGLSEDQRNNLFKEFSQADSSISRKFGGTGLGLVISKHLVDAMHGEIQVESEPERGSTFSFIISLSLADTEQQSLPDLSNHRIAFYEPSSIPRLSVSHLLTQWKIDCSEFSDKEAFTNELITGNQIGHQHDAIMIGLSNDDIISNRYADFLSDICQFNLPIIALANTAQHSLLDAVQAHGAMTTLSKPVEHVKLYQALHLALKGEHAIIQINNPISKLGDNKAPLVLAVDDNEANLKLVLALLEELNIPSLGASSGKEAIELVQNNPVSMVLMDIQMPVMNGMEATEIIRQDFHKQQLPIVALTAHAVADEKDKLLKSGMNDYMTKPISILQIRHSIEQWTGFQFTENLENKQPYQVEESAPTYETQQPDTKNDIQANTSQTISHQIFDKERALSAANQKSDLAIDMFSMLIESLGKEQLVLAELWQQQDLEQLLEAVHKLHGATRYCGTPELTSNLSSFETALKKKQEETYTELFNQLMVSINEVNEWAEKNDWKELLED